MSRHADRSRSSAARQRRHYRRIAEGRMVVSVEIDDVTVPQALERRGFLDADAKDDRAAIGRAIGRVIEMLVVTDASGHDP